MKTMVLNFKGSFADLRLLLEHIGNQQRLGLLPPTKDLNKK